MKKIYIASPYTKGDKEKNVMVQIKAYWQLFERGFLPIAPLLAHYVHIHYSLDYEQCMKIDFEWIKLSAAILRLPGESSGADREVEFANELNIPVFYSLCDLFGYFKNDATEGKQ